MVLLHFLNIFRVVHAACRCGVAAFVSRYVRIPDDRVSMTIPELSTLDNGYDGVMTVIILAVVEHEK